MNAPSLTYLERLNEKMADKLHDDTTMLVELRKENDRLRAENEKLRAKLGDGGEP